jgi:hypothetical protein
MAKWEIIEDIKFKKQAGGKATASRTLPAKRTAVKSAATPEQKEKIQADYNEAYKWTSDYMNSPMYKKMLMESSANTKEFNNTDNDQKNIAEFNTGWSLYLKQFDNYSAYFLNHDTLNKDISELFSLNNNSIISLYSRELIKVKMEIITLNEDDNITEHDKRRLVLDDGIYIGQVDEQGFRHGHGKFIFNDLSTMAGHIYVGEWKVKIVLQLLGSNH